MNFEQKKILLVRKVIHGILGFSVCYVIGLAICSCCGIDFYTLRFPYIKIGGILVAVSLFLVLAILPGFYNNNEEE